LILAQEGREARSNKRKNLPAPGKGRKKAAFLEVDQGKEKKLRREKKTRHLGGRSSHFGNHALTESRLVEGSSITPEKNEERAGWDKVVQHQKKELTRACQEKEKKYTFGCADGEVRF